MRPVAYLAGPYRDKRGEHYVLEHIWAAREVAVQLWQMGYAVVCPHLDTFMMGGAIPEEGFLEGLLAILEVCHLVVVLPGWEHSEGTLAEIACARERGLPICYWPAVPKPG